MPDSRNTPTHQGKRSASSTATITSSINKKPPPRKLQESDGEKKTYTLIKPLEGRGQIGKEAGFYRNGDEEVLIKEDDPEICILEGSANFVQPFLPDNCKHVVNFAECRVFKNAQGQDIFTTIQPAVKGYAMDVAILGKKRNPKTPLSIDYFHKSEILAYIAKLNDQVKAQLAAAIFASALAGDESLHIGQFMFICDDQDKPRDDDPNRRIAPEKIKGIVRIDVGARERFAMLRQSKKQLEHKTSKAYASSGQFGKEYMNYLLEDPVIKTHYLALWMRAGSGFAPQAKQDKIVSNAKAEGKEDKVDAKSQSDNKDAKIVAKKQAEAEEDQTVFIADLGLKAMESAIDLLPNGLKNDTLKNTYEIYFKNFKPKKNEQSYTTNREVRASIAKKIDIKGYVLGIAKEIISTRYQYMAVQAQNEIKSLVSKCNFDKNWVIKVNTKIIVKAGKVNQHIEESKDKKNIPKFKYKYEDKIQFLKGAQLLDRFLCDSLEKMDGIMRDYSEKKENVKDYAYYHNTYLVYMDNILAEIEKKIGSSHNIKQINHLEQLLSLMQARIEYSFFRNEDRAIDLVASIKIIKNKISFLKELQEQGVKVINPPESWFFSDSPHTVALKQFKKDIMTTDISSNTYRFKEEKLSLKEQETFRGLINQYADKQRAIIAQSDQDKYVAKEASKAPEMKSEEAVVSSFSPRP